MKVKYSAIGITNMSGKSGGSVASFNKFGSYIRRWAKPTNPKSDKQTAVRQAFGALSRMFGSLTPAEIEGWKQWGIDHATKDRFGDSRPMTAIGAFMSVNQNRLGIGLPVTKVTIAEYTKIPSFQLAAVTSVFEDVEITLDLIGLLPTPITGLTASVSAVVSNAGSNLDFGSVKNKYRKVLDKPITSASTSLELDPSTELGAVSGDVLFVSVKIINNAGLASSDVTLKIVLG